jgi:hypothetical protein
MKLTDHQMTGMLATMLGAPDTCETPEQVCHWAETYCQVFHAPVKLTEVRIVYERVSVAMGALKPVASQELVKYLEETEDDAILVPDLQSSGKDALFLAALCNRNQALEWLSRVDPANGTRFILGAKQNRLVVAASLRSFIYA